MKTRHMLRERGIPFENRSLKASTGSFGENCLVHILPQDASTSSGLLLVLAVPIEENSLGTESAIDLIVELLQNPPAIPLQVYFLDDELSRIPLRYQMPRHFGLRALIDEFAVPEEVSIVYFAPGNTTDRLIIQHGAFRQIAALEILRPLMVALQKDSIPWALETPWNELFRLGLVDGPAPLALLNEAGFQALSISAQTREDQILPIQKAEPISPKTLGKALEDFITLHPRVLDEPDRRYTLLHLGYRVWSLSEGFSIIAFLLVTVLSALYILVYSMTRRRILVARMHVFLRRMWILAILALVLFICLFAAELLVSFIYQKLVGSAQVIGSMHMAAKGLLTIIMAIAFYMLLNFLILYRRLPVRSHFWAVATIVFFAIATLVTASIDFTFVPVFLWAYVLSFISALFSGMVPSLLLAIIAMLPVANTVIGAAMTRGSRLLELFTTGSPLASLYMVVVLLPFMLLIKKSLPTRSRRLSFETIASRLPLRFTFCAVTIAACHFAFSSLPATPREDSARIQRISTHYPPGAPDSSIRFERSEFLDRQTLSITIPNPDKSDRVEIEIIGEEALFIYDSQLPWSADSSGRHISFVTGERPPNPLSFNVTLQRKAKGLVRVRKLSYDSVNDMMMEGVEVKRLEQE